MKETCHKMLKSIKKPNNILLLLILTVAAILRFWNFQHIPYMADELSALARTHFNNLNDLIFKGAQIDGHPVGVQVFLYYWTKLFGYSEMAVKFPFIIAGILSVYFIYKVAALWFNNTVGLITASFMATLQFMVMYSQIARPYISGMLFSILMVWCWTNYLFKSSNVKSRWLIGYVVFSSLCTYDHHLALLFAATVGLTGIFFLKKDTYKGYIIAGICIFILYIPHLKIFFYQLSIGGVGDWLGKQKPDYIFILIKYFFHFSGKMYILVFLLLLLSLIFRNKKAEANKFRIIALLWFSVQYLIAYYYSVNVSPILQYSTMIFVFPFFLMLIFSMFGELKKIFIFPIVLLVLYIGTSTLVNERVHYKIFYNQPFDKMVTNTYKILDYVGDSGKVTIDIFLPPDYSEIYFKKYNRKFNYTFYNQYNNERETKSFKAFVNNQKSDYFITGNLPLDYLSIVKEKYPFIFLKDEGFTYSFYCFSKIKHQTDITEKQSITNKSNTDTSYFNYSNPALKNFYQGNAALYMDSIFEYAPTLNIKIKDICHPYGFSIVNISVDVSTMGVAAKPVLVFDLHQDNKSIIWEGAELKYYNNFPLKNTICLSQLISYQQILDYPNAELRIYVWNRGKNNMTLSNFKFDVAQGSPNFFKFFLTSKSDKDTNYFKSFDSAMEKFYIGKSDLFMDSVFEYTPALNIKIKDMCNAFKFSIVNLAVDISTMDTAANPLLVFDLHQGNKSIIWDGAELQDFKSDPIKNRIYISKIISYRHILDYPDAELSIYVWNKRKNNMILSNFQFEVTEGNPDIFKLFLK